MRVLLDGKWQDGFLDEHRGEGAVRVRVRGMVNLEAVGGLYFVRRASLRMLLSYVREIGPVEVARKVVSRRRERFRNLKFVSAGVGEVLEADPSSDLSVGNVVVFVAPAHPACVERVVLPRSLVSSAPPDVCADLPPDTVAHMPAPPAGDAWWTRVAGWNPHAGRSVPVDLVQQAAEFLRAVDWRDARQLETAAGEPRECTAAAAAPWGPRPRAVLFGYGNYAKTVVLPNIAGLLQVVRVHEIDPLQISRGDTSVAWDTAPMPRADECFEAALIAGFHHTHASLAVEALRRGAYAVVEKPLATTSGDFVALIAAVRENPRLFACFHKRYMPFNAWALRDMGLSDGDPVSYHCVVYEVPLPALHWYRWPNSRSRLVSNGCHWIDHFLFLNGYAEPVAHDAHVASDGTVNCSVELANRAFFTMVLTDRGSDRIGVQDHVQLRSDGVTVTMTNGAEYVAERSDRIIRRKRLNKMRSYHAMYQTIGDRIVRAQPGDSLRSVEISTALMLALEARVETRVDRCGARYRGRVERPISLELDGHLP
jgi:predicted dehydrogenase